MCFKILTKRFFLPLHQKLKLMKDTQGDYKLLETIDSPADMKSLKPEQLIQLSNELRQYIIEIVSSNPGHFGASLGVVELTVALHHIFNAPHDQIVWDVGHQAYGHKILTGRRDVFHTNRKYGGIELNPDYAELALERIRNTERLLFTFDEVAK